MESIVETESCWVEVIGEGEVYSSGNERHIRLSINGVEVEGVKTNFAGQTSIE